MPISNTEREFVNYVIELMQSIGPVRAKDMFGGHGIFLDKFTYYKKEKQFKMSYYQAPEETLEDIEEMNMWVTKAYNTALRAAKK